MAATPKPASKVAAKPAVQLERAPWFAREIYLGIEQWGENEWVEALCCRRYLALHTKEGSMSMDQCAQAGSHWMAIASNLIRGNGLTQPLQLPTDKLYEQEPFSTSAVGIVDLTRDNIAEIRELCESGLFRLLLISKKASKRLILRDVGDWYDLEQDERAPRGGAITTDDMKNWAACQVLAYIDITLYQFATGIKYRSVDLQRALFGDMTIQQSGREPKKILEQSTRKYADRLLSDDFFHRLATERRHPSSVLRRSPF